MSNAPTILVNGKEVILNGEIVFPDGTKVYISAYCPMAGPVKKVEPSQEEFDSSKRKVKRVVPQASSSDGGSNDLAKQIADLMEANKKLMAKLG